MIARQIPIELSTTGKIMLCGTLPIIIWPPPTLTAIDNNVIRVYLIEVFPKYNNEIPAELTKDIKIDQAAPMVPYIGTSTKNAARNVPTLNVPIITSFFESLVVLNFDMAFERITEGRTAALSNGRTLFAVVYSFPINPNIVFGANNKTVMIGAVKARPILRLPVERSAFVSEDAGIDMNARLDAKLPATILIIIAI
jgi:hypothetical protein